MMNSKDDRRLDDLAPRDYRAELDVYASKLQELVADMTRELRESEHLYRSIVEEAADAIVTLDEDSRITSWNRGAVEVFGYSVEEALGRDIDELIAYDEAVATEAHDFTREAYSGGKIHSRETVRYTKDGQPRRVLISATPIVDEQGLVYLISLIYKDITNLYEAHQRLIQSEKQATLGIIAGSIGHELNNVVGGLLLHARELQRKANDPEKIREKARLLLGQVEKISLHGKNLLSLSQPTKPKMAMVNLVDLLEQTTEILVVSGVLKRLKVVKDYQKDVPPVRGDANLLEQVVRNLEINSAHAMEPGQILTIGCRLAPSQDSAAMFIKDSGPGIPPEIRDRIFEPFFTTKQDGKGTGLGLTIVKQIVEQHKGRLDLDTAVGRGTCVTISLPLYRSQ